MSSNEAVSSVSLHRGDLIQMSQFSANDYENVKVRVRKLKSFPYNNQTSTHLLSTLFQPTFLKKFFNSVERGILQLVTLIHIKHLCYSFQNCSCQSPEFPTGSLDSSCPPKSMTIHECVCVHGISGNILISHLVIPRKAMEPL